MRGFVLIFFLPILAIAQGVQGVSESAPDLQHYLTIYSSTDPKVYASQADFLSFVDKLQEKQTDFKSEASFLRYLFSKTHQKFLKNYREYSSFSELLQDGSYNCLTATALYALLLKHFNIDYQVIETNYHIFLVAETDKGRVLLETTDPSEGFVSSASAIEKRISGYRQNTIREEDPGKNYYRFSFDLYRHVGLDQMLGLLYYNHAVSAYNQHQLVAAVNYLDKAYALYQSPRMEEFSKIVLLSVVESKLENPVKERYIRKIQLIRKRSVEVVASAEKSLRD